MINRKKFIASFLIFSLMMLSANLYAKERRGAELIIQRIGDQVRQVEKTRLEGTPWETSVITGIWGELIAVKQNSLLLLDAGGKDFSVDIADIKVIRIVKKSKAGKGALTGLKLGGGLGLFAFVVNIGNEEHSAIASFVDTIILIGLPAVLIGAIIGGTSGKGKTIQIEGMSELEIKEAMEKLRKKARIRDYK